MSFTFQGFNVSSNLQNIVSLQISKPNSISCHVFTFSSTFECFSMDSVLYVVSEKIQKGSCLDFSEIIWE